MGAKVGRAALPHAGESRERESRGNGEEFAWPAVVRWRTTLHSVTCSLRVVRERSPLPAIYSKLVLFPGDAAGRDTFFQMLTRERQKVQSARVFRLLATVCWTHFFSAQKTPRKELGARKSSRRPAFLSFRFSADVLTSCAERRWQRRRFMLPPMLASCMK